MTEHPVTIPTESIVLALAKEALQNGEPVTVVGTAQGGNPDVTLRPTQQIMEKTADDQAV